MQLDTETTCGCTTSKIGWARGHYAKALWAQTSWKTKSLAQDLDRKSGGKFVGVKTGF